MDRIGQMGLFGPPRRLVILLAGLLTVLPVLAEEPLALFFSPELPREGQTFEAFFLLPDADGGDLQVKPPDSFPPNTSLVSGPALFPVSERDPETGRIGRYVKVLYRLRAQRAGRTVMEPLHFSLRGQSRQTDSAVLEIARRTGAPLVPFDLAWRVPETPIFQGQTIPVFLDMVNLPLIVVPESVNVTPPGGGVFEDAEGLGSISSLSAGGKELFRLTAASYLLTPSSPGNLLLRPARVKALGMTVESPRQLIGVKALPPEARSTGAVGSFRISSRLDSPEALPGDAPSLFIRLEGEGNLNYLQLPPLDFPDFTILGNTQTSSIVPGPRGYSGFVEWEIRLSPQKPGDLSIFVPPFPWIDGETGQLRTAPGRTHRLQVRETEAEKKSGRVFPVLHSGDAASREPLDAYRRAYAYLFFLPGLGLLLYGIFTKRKGALPVLLILLFAPALLLGTAPQDPKETLLLMEQGADSYNRGAFPEARELFSRALEEMPRNPGLHYNLGISYGALEEFPRALFHLRQALLLRPGQSIFREVLEVIEEEQGLFRQFPPPRLHPDMIFLVLVVTGNLALATPGGMKKRSTGLILGGVFLVLALFSLAGLVYTAGERGASWGVVDSPGAELRKIPLAHSSQWLNLTPGAVVRLRDSSGDYILARTGYGVEGWLEKDSLLRSGGEKGAE